MSEAQPPSASFDLDAFLDSERAAFERTLLDLDLDLLPEGVRPVVAYALQGGGKRLRPILCLAAYEAVGGAADFGFVRQAAASIEVVHGYSLVHDDLPFMDDDDLRRGRSTAHRAHGVATATVAGALMIPLAFEVLRRACVRLDADARAAARVLARGAGIDGMVGGQWLDLAGEASALSRPALERIHALKTGALIRAAVELGAVLGGAADEQVDALATYGGAVGLAFQIADDLLDARGDSIAIGKATGKDAARSKSTYPALLGLEGAERLARAEVERALRALDGAGIASPGLEALARYAVQRSH